MKTARATKAATKKLEQPALPPKPARRWRRRLVFWVVLPLLTLLALLKWSIAPFVVRHGVMEAVAANTQARLDIQSASVGLREVELRGVTLSDATGKVLGTADAVVLRLDRLPVGMGTPGVESVKLIRPDLVLTIEADGGFDLQRVLAPMPVPAKVANAAAAGSSPVGQGESMGASPKPDLLPETISVEDGTLRLITPFVNPTFSGLTAKIEVEPRRFVMATVEARTLAGRASISGWLGRGSNAGWNLQANVADADVRELARGTSLANRRLHGRLDGFLSLERGATGGALGAGWLDIHDGHLLELPVLLSVFNLFRGNAPGDSFVRTCRVDYRVEADRIHVDRSFVMTDGLCMFGEGDILYDGHRVDLDFVPRTSGEPPDGWDTLVEAEQPVADFVRKNFLANVRVTGTWMSPEAETTPLRVITGPIKAFFGLLKKK